MTKTKLLLQFTTLLENSEIAGCAKIYFDYAYMYRTELERILATNPTGRSRVKDAILEMSGDYTDQI